MVLYFWFECFMVSSNSLHQILEYLMSWASLMFWVHHIQQPLIILKLLNKCSPLGFVVYLPMIQFILYHVSELCAICSLLHPLVFFLFLLVAFFCFDYVFCKCVNSIKFMQFLVAVEIFELSSKLIPLHIISYLLLLKENF